MNAGNAPACVIGANRMLLGIDLVPGAQENDLTEVPWQQRMLDLPQSYVV